MNKSRRLVLLATILGSGVVFLDGTVVSLALPSISKDLNAGFSDLQWISDGYLLSLSSLLLLGGSLGDILGRKKMYLIGLYGFGGMSFLCGLAPNSEALILFRILQGIFGALLIPGNLAIINTNFPMEERGRAIGLWSAWSAAIAAIGPLVGGYLIDIASWRWIFFINIPLIAACIILTKLAVKESVHENPRKIDFRGSVLAALGLSFITYSLIEGPVMHWSNASFIFLALGLVFMVTFLWMERYETDPMVPHRLFKSRNFTAANLVTFMMYGALGGFMFALVIYLQTKMGYSAIKSGVSLIPVSFLLLFLSGRVGGWSTKYGPRIFMTIGPVLAGLGILLVVNLQPGDSYITFLLPRVTLFGIGLSLMVAPLTTTVMTSVEQASSGIASALNNVITRVAGLIVIALLGLFGTDHIFEFSMLLCGILAVTAGLISLVLIHNPKKALASTRD
jgi:EmrB/QacA subfamily drug resistance transporter